MEAPSESIEALWSWLKHEAQLHPNLQPTTAIVNVEINPRQPGRIKYMATYWFGRCEKNVVLPPGTPVRVLRREGNTWFVEPLSS
jgi:membrane protein implicated in regulation of membrane protease activity